MPRLERIPAARHHQAMVRRGALVLVLAAGTAACSLFHHPTPQQQMFDALNRGNAAQASQLWLSMSEKDRLKFKRGEGIAPAVPPEQVVKTLSETPPDENTHEITITAPNAGGTLMDLPKLANPQPPVTSSPVTAPEPANQQ
jgi:hypothetical protein